MHTVEALGVSEAERDEERYFRPEKSSQERGIVLLLFVSSCLYLKFFYNYTTLHSDEGIVLEGAQRILQGQVPYRDFFSFYTPGSYYWTALLFKIFGNSILVPRTALVVYGGVFSALTYLLARRVCSRGSSLLATGLALLVCLPYSFYVQHSWDSSLLAFLTLYSAIRLLETPGTTAAFGTGSLAALTVLFEHSKGERICAQKAISHSSSRILVAFCSDIRVLRLSACNRTDAGRVVVAVLSLLRGEPR